MTPRIRNGRPTPAEAQARRDEFARLVADDMRRGGLDEAHRNVVHNARSVRLNPERALRLSYDPSFVAEVERLVGFSSLKQSPESPAVDGGDSLCSAALVKAEHGVPGDNHPGDCLSEVSS